MATPMEMVMETDGAMYVKLDPSGKVRVRVCLPLIYCWSQVPGKIKAERGKASKDESRILREAAGMMLIDCLGLTCI